MTGVPSGHLHQHPLSTPVGVHDVEVGPTLGDLPDECDASSVRRPLLSHVVRCCVRQSPNGERALQGFRE